MVWNIHPFHRGKKKKNFGGHPLGRNLWRWERRPLAMWEFMSGKGHSLMYEVTPKETPLYGDNLHYEKRPLTMWASTLKRTPCSVSLLHKKGHSLHKKLQQKIPTPAWEFTSRKKSPKAVLLNPAGPFSWTCNPVTQHID